MANTPKKLKVFLCHASEDKPIVRELYDRLRMDGFDPWLDSELLVPGENWPLEIQKAMRASQAVVVCLSDAAIVKEGYIHTEIKTAQSLQMEKPEGTIFFIPLQLEECDLPFSMRDIHWGKYFEPDGYERLVKALNKRAEQVKAAQGVIKSRKKPAAKAAPKKGNSVRGGDNAVVIGKDANQAVIVPGSGNVINVNYGSTPAATQPPEAKTEPPQGGLPPGSHLPFSRNAFFTGREKDLEKLASDLTPNPFAKHPNGAPGRRGGNVVITQAITGMGGIGKTQLAVEFAYRYGDQFKGVHWLDLRDPAALDEQIAACGEKMDLQPWSEKMPEQVALTLRAWQTDGARLLILDNFESVKDASQVLARFQSPSLRLLITSRHSDWPSTLGLHPVPLDTFTPAESRKFLKKYLKNRSTNEDLDQLAERLGHLPLALELAGRYFEGHPRLSVPQYLTRLEQAFEHDSMRGFRADLPNPTQHDLDLLATFTLSWEQVKSEPTQKIFLAAGYCAANTAIPPEIFEKTAELDETACDESIQTLIGLGLLGEKTTIHPLLAEFARRLDSEQEILKKLTGTLAEIAVERNAAVDQTGNSSLYTPLLSHVRIVAEKAELSEIEKASNLWNDLGYHLHTIADYRGEKFAYERALRILEKQPGEENPNVATLINNLGSVLHDLGDLEGAKAAFERALKIDEAVHGLDNPEVAIGVNNLGAVLQDLGDLAGAKAAYERALKIDEAIYGSDHPKVAIRVNNLGWVLKDLGDLEGAKAAIERALHIIEKSLGPEHPQVAFGVNNLGEVLRNLGDLEGAKAAFERTLQIWETLLGPYHPQVALGVNNLGATLENLGDLAGAKAAFERALRIDEKALGPDHPNVARDINNLGLVLKDLGDLVGAKAAYERALKIDEATYRPDHPNVARDVNNLGTVLQALGDLAGAKAAYERALKIDEATYGPDHPNVARDVNNLGAVLQDLGDLAGAKAAYERAVKIWEASLGTEHPQVATGVNNLGEVLRSLGDLAGAKAAFERAIKIFEKQLGEDHPNVATPVNNLGGALQYLGDSTGAKAAYERALEIDEAAYGPDHPSVARDVNNLGFVLKDLGDLEGAKTAYERALRIFKQFLPLEHPNIKIVQENLDSISRLPKSLGTWCPPDSSGTWSKSKKE